MDNLEDNRMDSSQTYQNTSMLDYYMSNETDPHSRVKTEHRPDPIVRGETRESISQHDLELLKDYKKIGKLLETTLLATKGTSQWESLDKLNQVRQKGSELMNVILSYDNSRMSKWVKKHILTVVEALLRCHLVANQFVSFSRQLTYLIIFLQALVEELRQNKSTSRITIAHIVLRMKNTWMGKWQFLLVEIVHALVYPNIPTVAPMNVLDIHLDMASEIDILQFLSWMYGIVILNLMQDNGLSGFPLIEVADTQVTDSNGLKLSIIQASGHKSILNLQSLKSLNNKRTFRRSKPSKQQKIAENEEMDKLIGAYSTYYEALSEIGCANVGWFDSNYEIVTISATKHADVMFFKSPWHLFSTLQHTSFKDTRAMSGNSFITSSMFEVSHGYTQTKVHNSLEMMIYYLACKVSRKNIDHMDTSKLVGGDVITKVYSYIPNIIAYFDIVSKRSQTCLMINKEIVKMMAYSESRLKALVDNGSIVLLHCTDLTES